MKNEIMCVPLIYFFPRSRDEHARRAAAGRGPRDTYLYSDYLIYIYAECSLACLTGFSGLCYVVLSFFLRRQSAFSRAFFCMTHSGLVIALPATCECRQMFMEAKSCTEMFKNCAKILP